MKENKNIVKIVLTGGPCAGKTTGMSWIQNTFTQMGYAVLFVPETATELISGGVAPWNFKENVDFQDCLFQLQLEKERVFYQAAEKIDSDKVLIVCDRGILDNLAYMSHAEFENILKNNHLDEVELRDNYDAVFHLVTAAKGAEEFYTTENNTARTETPEQAAAVDDKIISAWTGHPHFRVIGNNSDFETKMKKLIKEISSFLGEPIPLEIERKYLIEYPDLEWLKNEPNCQKIEIIQTYIIGEEGSETRIRQRGINGHYVYFLTEKKTISDLKRVEIERRLTRDEYLKLLMKADTTKHQIRKDRYCLTWENQYFEIDVYPFWKNKAIMEIELSDQDDEINIPSQIKVIREVTAEPEYRNASLAKTHDK